MDRKLLSVNIKESIFSQKKKKKKLNSQTNYHYKNNNKVITFYLFIYFYNISKNKLYNLIGLPST